MKSKDIFTVNQITEPDYGCEETGRKKPTALLKLVAEDGSVTHAEVLEETLASRGISEGKRVVISSEGEVLKYIRVVAAVIRGSKHHAGKIFATARGYGEYKGWWEFPGGKIEPGETPQEALKREIREELATTISVGKLIKTIEYDYPKFHLSMDCFWAKVVSGHLELKEAEDAKWLAMDELDSVNWLPADKDLIDEILADTIDQLS